jgi:hypothetical protein
VSEWEKLVAELNKGADWCDQHEMDVPIMMGINLRRAAQMISDLTATRQLDMSEIVRLRREIERLAE